MITGLVIAELRNRPARAALLLFGYALGVAVMVVLLAVGEAMLTQASDGELLGGGDVVLVPAGVNPEMIRAGGTGALFLGIEQARFVQRQILESPRGREDLGVVAASPLIDSRIVRIERGGRSFSAVATGEIPSRADAAGAMPSVVAGSWLDSPADRAWTDPTDQQLYDELDAFHLPTGSAVNDSTWAEWHYFNVVLDAERWLYLTFLVGGNVGMADEWGGQVLATIRDRTGSHRSITLDVPATSIALDTATADLRLDASNRVEQVDGTYRVRASVQDLRVELDVRPAANRFFPPTDLGGEALASGYVVPALAATASGRVCLPGSSGALCEEVEEALAYHDHNWGVWRDVAWEWGAASGEVASLLYGAVRGPTLPEEGIFAYLVDGRGVRGVYRASAIEPLAFDTIRFEDATIAVPSRLRLEDSRRGLAVVIDVTDHHVTDMDRAVDRFFVQMRGVATVTESGGATHRLEGFFETYADGAGTGETASGTVR